MTGIPYGIPDVDERQAREILRRFGALADAFHDCFGRGVQRDAASQYIEGLFNDSERKSMQAMHGRLSDPVTHQALQHFITHSPWEAQPLWDRLRTLVQSGPPSWRSTTRASRNKARTAPR